MIILPIELKKYFWDCDFAELDFSKHKNYILNRLLYFGDIYAIKFITNYISQDVIKTYLKQKGKLSLNISNLKFWEKLVAHDDLWEN